jgi:transposase
VSERQIAITIGISRSTVGEYLRRAAVIDITWPVPEGMDDAELERRLFTAATFDAKPTRPLPDWTHIHRELKRRSVTLLLLWEEYRAQHPDGYGYSRFCDFYGEWRETISPTMRQAHGPAEKLFVDFAGDTVPVFDAATGALRLAHIFVAVLGASNYTYAEARWSEGLADWIGLHVNALNAIGGVPKAVVCDNLKAGVTATCRYEPGINRTYQELAEHYGTAILPTRPRKPRDKAKVEVAVQIVQRFVLARLRNRRFFSLYELNAAIRETLGDLNAKIMRKLGVSRNELFAEIDRPALKALPSTLYQYAEWKKCRIAPDYHVEIADHYYSVPSRLIRQELEARITDTTVEILHRGHPCRQPRPLIRAASPHHASRAHAERASTLCRMGAGADQTGSCQDRSRHDCSGRGDHEGQATPRARLPRLSRYSAARAQLRLGPHRGRLSTRQ